MATTEAVDSYTDLPDDPPRPLVTLAFEWPLLRRVLRLGSFVIMAMVTQFLVNYFDTLMLGHLDGPIATASQAALGLGMPLFWGVGGFFAAIAAGTQAITARRYAEGDARAAGQVLWNSLLVSIVAGLVGTVVGVLVTRPGVAVIATASAAQEQLAVQYTELRMLGILGMVVTFSYKAFFDGIGRTAVHLWAALVMNVANIVLNYLLIYGNAPLGIPRLEIVGASAASVVSTYVGLLVMIGASLRGPVRERFWIYRARVDGRIVARILQLMLPSGLATVILMTGFALFMRFVGQIDAHAGHEAGTFTAATKAIMDTTSLCFMPLIAFGTATATCVSQSLGAGKPNLAARYGWESVRLAAIAMIVVGGVMFAAPESIIGLLAPNDPEVPRAAAQALRICTFALAPMAVGLVLAQALYGAGANAFVATAELVLHFGVLVPLSWLLGPTLGYGMEGVWSAAAVYACLLGVVMASKFASTGWRKIRL